MIAPCCCCCCCCGRRRPALAPRPLPTSCVSTRLSEFHWVEADDDDGRCGTNSALWRSLLQCVARMKSCGGGEDDCRCRSVEAEDDDDCLRAPFEFEFEFERDDALEGRSTPPPPLLSLADDAVDNADDLCRRRLADLGRCPFAGAAAASASSSSSSPP